MEWKDCTSYSRSDKARIPRVLEADMGVIRIVIHRIIHCEGWYLTVYGLSINDSHLSTDNLEEAKSKGLEFVIGRVVKLEKIKGILITNLN